MRLIILTKLILGATSLFSFANADGLKSIGKPIPGGMGFQPAVTELARDLQWLDGMVNIIIIAISLFVTVLLLWAAYRYNKKRNPNPATFTHNSTVEILWTIIPIVILLFIGAFSVPILFKQQEIPEADITIKVTGNQWYWGYEYVDHDFGFDSVMLQKDELADNLVPVFFITDLCEELKAKEILNKFKNTDVIKKVKRIRVEAD